MGHLAALSHLSTHRPPVASLSNSWSITIDNHQKGFLIRGIMKTSMDRLHVYDSLPSEIVSNEVEFLSETLGNLRDSGEISNDAYLEAGGIQGGLSLIARLIDQEVSDDEIQMQLDQLITRALRISTNYPEMDEKIENYRS